MEKSQKRPLSLKELKVLRKPLRNINVEHAERFTRLEKLAMFVTGKVGTMGFFLVIFIWTVLWLAWNTLGPASLRFDPFPAFVMWLFISNMIQILLMPLIMVGQNLEGRHAKARAESDFEVNMRTEREIEAVIEHLENQNELIIQILRKIKNR